MQRYFCIDDQEKLAFARVTKDAIVLSKEPKTVTVRGKEIKGWIITVMTPSTDGRVKLNHEETGDIVIESPQ